MVHRFRLVTLALAFCLPLAAHAQDQAGGMAGIGSSRTVTARAKVQSVDTATRAVKLIGPAGNTFTVIAGPQVINFDRIRAGDTVVARYQESVVYVLSPPNGTIPEASLTADAVAAPKGADPAGAVSARLIVTGLVVGIDPGNHTLQMVDPSGGAVTTAQVTSEAGLRNFDQIRVGDRITAVISAALAVALDPAT